MAETPIPALPPVPADVDPNTRNFLESLKQAVEIRLGRLGDPLDQAVTLRQLIDGDLVVLANGATYVRIGQTPAIEPNPDIANDQDAIYTPPPSPNNFVAVASSSNVILSWDDPDAQYGYHGLTEVWRNTVDNLGTAQLLGTAPGRIYVDAVDPATTYYYWIRFRSAFDVTGDYNSPTGTLANTAQFGTNDLTDLIITAAKLADGAVQTAKLSDQAVTDLKLAADAVTATKIATGAVLEDALADNAVTVSKLNVDLGGGNLLRNSSYESDTPADWNQIWSASLSFSSAEYRYGSRSIEVVAQSNPSGGGGVRHDMQIGTWLPANTTVVGSAWVKGPNGVDAQISMFPEDINTGSNLAGGQGATNFTFNGGWQRVKTAPTTWTADFRGTVDVRLSDAGTADVFYVDGMQLEVGEVATAYAPKVSELLPGSVGSTELAIGAVATVNIQTSAVTETEIANGAISTPKLQANAVTANEIAAGTITANEIAANTITSGQIAANTITSGQIAANTITSNEIAANAITASELNANSVTSAKIAAGAVVAGKIGALAVSTNELAANAVTAAKIAAGTITANEIQAGTITASEIAAATITGAKIAGGTITAANILGGTITGAEIANATITSSNIANAAIGNAAIANLAVTDAKIADLSADKLFVASGTIADAIIGTGHIDNAKIGDTIQSSNYVAGTSGWRISKTGNIEVNSGEMVLRSAVSGERIEIDGNQIKVYDSNSILRVVLGDLTGT